MGIPIILCRPMSSGVGTPPPRPPPVRATGVTFRIKWPRPGAAESRGAVGHRARRVRRWQHGRQTRLYSAPGDGRRARPGGPPAVRGHAPPAAAPRGRGRPGRRRRRPDLRAALPAPLRARLRRHPPGVGLDSPPCAATRTSGPPSPSPALDGALVQDVAVPEAPGAPEPHDCVLFRWIPGPALADRLTLENVRRLGVLSARLHAHAAGFRPPPALPVRTLDQFPGRGEREVLFSHEHPLFLPPARRAVFERVAAALPADRRRAVRRPRRPARDPRRPAPRERQARPGPPAPAGLLRGDLGLPGAGRRPDPLRPALLHRPAGAGLRRPARRPSPAATPPACPGPRRTPASWTRSSPGAGCARPTGCCGARRPRSPPTRAPCPTRRAIVPYFERVEAEFRALLDGAP